MAELGVRPGTSPEASQSLSSEQASGTTPDTLLLTHGSESPTRASSSAIAGLGRRQTGLS